MDKSAVFALNNAQREGNISGLTAEKYGNSFSQFTEFVRDEFGVKDLNNANLSHVTAYAEHVGGLVSAGEITEKTGQQLISNVNRTLEIMSGSRELSVSPSEHAGSTSGIATEARENTPEQWAEAREAWAESARGERIEACAELQRELGLRFEESSKIDAKQALDELRETGSLTVTEGTKNGGERVVEPVDIERAEAALERAAELQGDHHSMIPEEMSYAEWQDHAYNTLRDTDYNFHDNRHEFACEKYEQITGHCAPVLHDNERPFLESLADACGVSVHEAREIDREARLEVAESLGHHRIDVTNAYLGSSYA